MRAEHSCGAVIFRQAAREPEFLLIKHRRGGHWGFPKGHVEAGETEEQTARREVYEETGLQIALLAGFRHAEVYAPAPDVAKTVVYFLAIPLTQTVRYILPEVVDHGWLPFHAASERLPFESQQAVLNHARRHLTPALPPGQGFEHFAAAEPSAALRTAPEACASDAENQRFRRYSKNIIDSMPSALIGVDWHGRISQWNRGAEHLTGLPEARAQGRAFAEIFPEFARIIEFARSAGPEQQIRKHTEVPYETNGERHYVDITISPLAALPADIEEQHSAGAVIRIDDVTERTRLKELMVQSEKMMTVGRLAAGMAHEINNPLGVILQGLENTIRRFSPANDANRQAAAAAGIDLACLTAYLQQRHITQYIDEMRTAALRISRIVADMLHFSRPTDSSIMPVDLSQIIEHAIDLAASDTEHAVQTIRQRRDRFGHIRLVRAYDPLLPKVRCIPNEIEQVILSLLRNAFQALDEQSDASAMPRIRISTHTEAAAARIEITDNGPGIETANLTRVFDPFYTTRPVGAGIGLGLSIAYFIIVSHHHGEMRVNSEPGNGTTFTIRLPLSADQ